KKQNTTTQVFLIPGLDGCGTVFNHLAPNIEFSATSLHYNANIDGTTNFISETTDYLTNHILPKLKDGKDFVIVGYSFGSVFAVELTRRLEAMNFNCRLVLIDGAPEQMRKLHEYFTSDINDADIQISILTNMMDVYSVESSEKTLMELKKCITWEERLNIFAKQLLTMNTSLSHENLKTLCTRIYKNLFVMQQYDSTLPPIKSPIILLKPTNPLPVPITEDDYGLQKITQNVVKVHYIEGNHVTIMKNEKVSAAINGEPPFIF
ncbi:PREDICTED: uncharacterized protein LOC105461741, partial [Wasmannia auropunctata]|uniref:uncharacterized protein LOC105461741 n=1 Tax=Wasmannia auropunctata TaxID=64793 RepID=UPI0005EF7F00